MANAFSLKDKVIIITGGAGILGHSFIEGIIEAGGIAVILDRNEALAQQRAEEVNKNGGRAAGLFADVLEESSLVAARDEILKRFGRIDGLINAAGGNRQDALLQPGDDIFKMGIEGMKKVMELNLWGSVIPTQIFGAVMAEAGRGSIVNISSMSSQRAITRVMGYSLAKAAIDCYTRWFAVELANRYGDAIRMNAIAPGFFLTEQNRTLLTNPDGSYTERAHLVLKQTPYKRFGTPDELKGAVVWLLSDASGFVTGTIINIDGGFFVNSGV